MTNQSPLDLNSPASIESEMALLGAVLVNQEVFLSISSFLHPDDFFLLKHQYTWTAMQNLSNRRMPIDVLTVAEELDAAHQLEPSGGMAYLTQLLNSTPSSVHAEFYGQIVERASVRRRLMRAADEMRALAKDEQLDLESVISKSETNLFNVTERQMKRDFHTMRDAVGAYFDRIDSLIQNPGSSYGVPSGFRDLDALLGGFQRQALMIFAGRPGMGKTSFLLSAAVNAARQNQSVAIFTMEMGAEELVQRMVAMETAISSEKLRRGELNAAEYNRFVEAAGRISDFPIYIDDTPGLNPIQLRTKTRRLQHEFGLDLVIVDYLQLMNGGAAFQNNRVQEIGYISRSLKELARELNVPVFSAAQLSRAVESRQDKRPQLSDLRESGCLTGDSRVYLPDEGRFVPIQALVGQSGFRVTSLNTETWKLESSEVSAVFSTGTQPVYRIQTGLGRTIRATANHKFLTIHGWKRLDELHLGERLAVAGETALVHHWMLKHPASKLPISPLKGLVLGEISDEARASDGESPFSGLPVAKGSMGFEPHAAISIWRPIGCHDGETLGERVDWDEITDISPDGVEPVYDLTVPVNHNFVAENIIVHNSIEQDADVVMFLYRDVVYNQATEFPNQADVIVAKHRNGRTDTISLYFDGSLTKFMDGAVRRISLNEDR